MRRSTLPINFAVDPQSYRHWRLALDGPVATVTMAVTPDAGLRDDYELKLNSYDLSVDIELYDIVQRLRFGHPEVRCVVVTGGIDKVFCAGANIQMLATSTHGHKVNFCKFTNETRNGIEDATANSRQVWIAAVNGTAAGGGYELALACDEILLVDDRASAVSLPEVPMLAVLPGTGGLTRLVDKRFVRRDLADVFATRTEGIKGQQAVDWGLVDAVAPKSSFDELVATHADARAETSDRPSHGQGIELPALGSSTVIEADTMRSTYVDVDIDRELGSARLTVRGPDRSQPVTGDELASSAAAPGSCRPHSNSTMPSSTCGSTNHRSARGSSRRAGASRRSARPRACSATTATTGSCAKPDCSGRARSSGSMRPPARSWPWSSRGAASPACSPNWCWPRTGR